MDLPDPIKNVVSTAERLNAKLAPGLKVTKIELHSGNVPQRICTTYDLTLPTGSTDSEKLRAEEFIKSTAFIIGKTRKGKTKDIDIRPLIQEFSFINSNTVRIQMVSASAQAGIKPLEALTEILRLDKDRCLQTRILKTDWQKLD
jgi:hypothetical protein